MKTLVPYNYEKIALAIAYISEHIKEQPSLEDVASSVNMSPFHFQKIFTSWVGISPKKFSQYLNLNYAKLLLKEKEMTLFDTTEEVGLSSTGRLHDLFINIEGMTPGEYKNGGENLSIYYSFHESPFGEVIIASTDKGICHLGFVENGGNSLEYLNHHFPNAKLTFIVKDMHKEALGAFLSPQPTRINLHILGTSFQIKVWEALLKIQTGSLSTYGRIAKDIENKNASRAVGTAIGSNPIAFFIPCHRVIRSTGDISGYLWGTTRKKAMIGYEAARLNHGHDHVKT